jgi:Zn-dependent protease
MSDFFQFLSAIDWSSLGTLLLRVTAILLCLVIHEVSHGLAAYRLGDPTAKRSHRLSLNPLRHLDFFGLLMMITVGFGWAKPVPVDPRYFKNPKRGMAITSLAGPVSNFIMAYVCYGVANALCGVEAARGTTALLEGIIQFLAILVYMNIGLGIFNLIPFPPLDGSKVLAMFLPDRAYVRWMRLERYGMVVLMVILCLGWLDGILTAARSWVLDLMTAGTAWAFDLAYGLLT